MNDRRVDMNCKKCNKTIKISFKYCPYCGNRIMIREKVIFVFKALGVILIIVGGTLQAISTRKIYIIFLWILFLIFVFKYIALNKLIDYFSNANKPNCKLIIKLYDLRILNQNDLFSIDYSRLQKGLVSIFNNGEGLTIKCENNCNEKNEIQKNFIKQTKNKNIQND